MVFSAACICFSPFLCPEFQLLQPLWCPLLSCPEGTVQLVTPASSHLVHPDSCLFLPFPACPTSTHPPGEDVPELLLPLPTASFPPLPGSHSLTAAFLAFCLCALLLHWMRTHCLLHFVPKPGSVCVQGWHQCLSVK